jgi:hypothetical protein
VLDKHHNLFAQLQKNFLGNSTLLRYYWRANSSIHICGGADRHARDGAGGGGGTSTTAASSTVLRTQYQYYVVAVKRKQAANR